MNGPKSRTPEASKLIKRAAKAYGERKRYKKVLTVREKEACTQTLVAGTQTQIYVESESQIETEERSDAIIISDKYVVSNMVEMSDSESDSDEDKLRLFKNIENLDENCIFTP